MVLNILRQESSYGFKLDYFLVVIPRWNKFHSYDQMLFEFRRMKVLRHQSLLNKLSSINLMSRWSSAFLHKIRLTNYPGCSTDYINKNLRYVLYSLHLMVVVTLYSVCARVQDLRSFSLQKYGYFHRRDFSQTYEVSLLAYSGNTSVHTWYFLVVYTPVT